MIRTLALSLALLLPVGAAGAAPGGDDSKPASSHHKKKAKQGTSAKHAAKPAKPNDDAKAPAASAIPAPAPASDLPHAAPAPTPAPAAASSAGSDPSLDFDLMGAPAAAPEAPKTDPDFERRVSTRRTMLVIHQALGTATWLTLGAADVVGQLNLNDKYRGGGDTGRYYKLHSGLAFTATGLFAAVGLLGLLAPEPYHKGFRFDTTTIHKVFQGLATVGMLGQVGLGIYTASREGHLDQRQLATAHQVIGWATWGAMSAGALTLVF